MHKIVPSKYGAVALEDYRLKMMLDEYSDLIRLSEDMGSIDTREAFLDQSLGLRRALVMLGYKVEEVVEVINHETNY